VAQGKILLYCEHDTKPLYSTKMGTVLGDVSDYPRTQLLI